MSDPLEPPPGNDGLPDAHLVVPDDPRELDRDVEAWRREERWLRRRRLVERAFFARSRREHAISAPLVALILIGVALLGATITILAPHQARTPTSPVPLRLAAPNAPAGTAGGLLPDAVLKVDGDTGEVSVRDLRPSVIAVVAASCDCRDQVSALARAAAAQALSIYLVGSPAQADQLVRLAAQTNRDDVHSLIDPTFAIIDSYPPQGLSVIPVHADGVTEQAFADYDGDPSLGAVLVDLRQPGPA
jgi:hypothetical protein